MDVCRRAGVKCCALKAVSGLHFPDRPAPTDQFSSNLAKVVKDALKSDAVQFVEILDHEAVSELVRVDGGYYNFCRRGCP